MQQTQNQYNLRIQNDFRAPLIRSVSHGSDSISFIGPNIWNSLPSDLKQLEFRKSFKKQIWTWKPEGCSCRLCKTYKLEQYVNNKYNECTLQY